MATYVADASAGADRAGGLFLLFPCFFRAGRFRRLPTLAAVPVRVLLFWRDPAADRLPDGVPFAGKGARRGFCAFLCKVQEIYFFAIFFMCLFPRLGALGGVLRVFVLLSIKTQKRGVFTALAGCFFVAVVAFCTKKAG